MIQVRPMTSDDAPHLSQLFLLSRIETFHWCPPDSFQLEDFYRETEGETVFIAHENDCPPVGFISVWAPDSFVHHLFVASGEQRKGVGSALLSSLDSWLPRPYRLKCLVANASALSFYVNRGWTEIRREGDSWGQYALMELG